MKLTLKTITDPSFTAAFTKLCQQPVALVDSLRLARAARMIERAGQDFNAARLKFFQSHGRLEGANWVLDPSDSALVQRHNDEMTDLLAIEIDLPLPGPIPLPPECKLTAMDLLPLLDLIDA